MVNSYRHYILYRKIIGNNNIQYTISHWELRHIYSLYFIETKNHT